MTLTAIHDTLYRKSHQICRKVQSGEDLFPIKIFTAPQHTRFILPPFHLDKILRLYCVGGIFLFWELVRASPSILLRKTVPLLKKTLGLSLLRYACKRKPYLENFISRPDVIPTFRQRRCKTGAGTSFGANGDPLHEQIPFTYFLRLNNSETFVENEF